MSTLAQQFLEEPVPPSGGKEWKDWSARYGALKNEDPQETAALFLHGLEHGDLAVQYAAVLGLRMIGYEAWGLGYEPELRYQVRSPGGDQTWVIVPKIQNLQDADG